MRIYLIRHGRQSSTLCNVNVPLAEAGIEQAHLAGKRLAAYGIDAIYASDLIRARETAQIIKEEVLQAGEGTLSADAEVQVRSELREIDFGALEGKTDAAIKVEFKEFLEKRDLLEEDLTFPEGECGADVIARFTRVLKELEEGSYESVAIVTHGGAIRSILTSVLQMDPANKLLISLSLENTSITELFYHKEKKRYYVERIYDYAHLEAAPHLLRRNWSRE